MNQTRVALVIADIKNMNLGDSVIFKSLSSSLISSGFTRLYKVADFSRKEGNITFVNYKNPIFLLKSIFSSDSVIVGGGGIFQDETSQINLIYFFLLVMVAFLLNKKILIKGVGITPLNTKLSSCLVRLICMMTNEINVRDDDSKKILSKYTNKPIGVSEDLALSYEPDFTNIPTEIKDLASSKYLLVSLRPLNENPKTKTYFTEKNRQNFESIFISTLSELSEDFDINLVFVPFHGATDYKFITKVCQNKLKENDKILKSVTPDTFCYLAKNSVGVISMRLHGAILASLYPVPLWAIEYDDKVSHFMRSIRMESFSLKVIDVKDYSAKIRNELLLRGF